MSILLAAIAGAAIGYGIVHDDVRVRLVAILLGVGAGAALLLAPEDQRPFGGFVTGLAAVVLVRSVQRLVSAHRTTAGT